MRQAAALHRCRVAPDHNFHIPLNSLKLLSLADSSENLATVRLRFSTEVTGLIAVPKCAGRLKMDHVHTLYRANFARGVVPVFLQAARFDSND